jgi:uncharacterized repeat protein (TIGR03803 family)
MIFLKSVGQMSRMGGLVFVLLSVVEGSTPASAQTLTTLSSFNGSNGAYPAYVSLIADANGDLFGTTEEGGVSGYGTVFEIVKTSSDYGTPATLVSFDNTNGANPVAGLIADANGNLFGTTMAGGASGDGTVFEIVKISGGYASTPTTLVSFNNTNGAVPIAGLVTDANGDLFGTTLVGGASGNGTVFEIVKTSSGYASTPTTLISFDDLNGALPAASLIADASGNLFGTTEAGGALEDGTVFEIVKTSSGYASTPTTLVTFEDTNGAVPAANLVADANGNLFGTTYQGGALEDGTVFEIVKISGGYASTPTTLVTFDNTNGANPLSCLIADANGNLFGTTSAGEASGSGTVFEVTKTSSGYSSTPTTLVSFDTTNGAFPLAGLIADANGNLFGTTEEGGAFGTGTVFEVTGSGFVPPRQKHFAGTPGSGDCTGKSISTLAQTYKGIAHAASALGYANVTALQSAIAEYCSN